MSRRCPVRTAAKTPNIITEAFRGFSQLLEGAAGFSFKFGPLPSISFSTRLSPVTLPLNTIQSEIVTYLLTEQSPS
jgi:hypothetical protein